MNKERETKNEINLTRTKKYQNFVSDEKENSKPKTTVKL